MNTTTTPTDHKIKSIVEIETSAGIVNYGLIEGTVEGVFATPSLHLRIEGHDTVKVLTYAGEVSPPVMPGDNFLAAVPMFNADLLTNPCGTLKIISTREQFNEKERIYMLKLERDGKTIGLYFGSETPPDSGMTSARKHTFSKLVKLIAPELDIGEIDLRAL